MNNKWKNVGINCKWKKKKLMLFKGKADIDTSIFRQVKE